MGEALTIAATQGEPAWSMSPSPFHWQVMIYGGECPRTGFAQQPLEFQLFKRNHGTGYTLDGAVRWAEDKADWHWRARFVVRDNDGTIVHRGVCGRERRRQEYLASVDKGLRTFDRLERRTGGRAA